MPTRREKERRARNKAAREAADTVGQQSRPQGRVVAGTIAQRHVAAQQRYEKKINAAVEPVDEPAAGSALGVPIWQ